MGKKDSDGQKRKRKKIAIVNHWQLPLQLIATSLLSNISERNNDVISFSKTLMIMVVMTFFLIIIWVFGCVSLWVCESLGLWVFGSLGNWVFESLVAEFLSLWVFGPLSNISEVNNDLISISKMLMIMVMMTNHWPFKVGCDQNQMIFKLRSAVKSHLTKCDFVQSGVYRKMPHHVKSIPWQVEYVINLMMKPFKWCV